MERDHMTNTAMPPNSAQSAPLVTVVIPAFNASDFIAEAISSVQAQTIEDWEIVIVDDGSTDQTLFKAQEAATGDQRISIIRFEENQGISASCNAAIGAAKGLFIARLDADDRATPTRLASQLAAFQANDRLAAVGGHAFVFGSDVRGVAYCNLSDASIKANLLSCGNNLSGNTLMVRKKFVTDHGILYDKSLVSAEDIDYLISIMAAGGEFMNVDEVVIDHRKHAASITKSRYEICIKFLQEARLRVLRLWYPSIPSEELEFIRDLFIDRFAPNFEKIAKSIFYVDKVLKTDPMRFGQDHSIVQNLILRRLGVAVGVYRDSGLLNESHLEAIGCGVSPAVRASLKSLGG